MADEGEISKKARIWEYSWYRKHLFVHHIGKDIWKGQMVGDTFKVDSDRRNSRRCLQGNRSAFPLI